MVYTVAVTIELSAPSEDVAYALIRRVMRHGPKVTPDFAYIDSEVVHSWPENETEKD